MKNTFLYISNEGDVVGVHMPNDFTPPEEIELTNSQDESVLFKLEKIKSRKGRVTITDPA